MASLQGLAITNTTAENASLTMFSEAISIFFFDKSSMLQNLQVFKTQGRMNCNAVIIV